MYKNILIVSSTRTGSTFIRNFFYNNGDSYNVKNNRLEKNKNNILQSHAYKIRYINPKEWNCILSTRVDKFDQICSKIIADSTKQWKDYNKLDIQIDVNFDEIVSMYLDILRYENHWKEKGKKSFLTFHEITFEQLFENHNTLYNIAKIINFDLQKNETQKVSIQSPYSKYKVIKNYSSLKKKFTRYIQKNKQESNYEF